MNYILKLVIHLKEVEEAMCRMPVKVFDIQHQSTSGSGVSVASEMATSIDGGGSTTSDNSNKQQNFSLVKLFMKQKSISAEGKLFYFLYFAINFAQIKFCKIRLFLGMSTALDQSSISEHWPVGHSEENNQNVSQCKPKKEAFLDSLLMQNKNNCTVEEQDEMNISRSESIEQLSESISESLSDNKPAMNPIISTTIGFNVNNNNSVELNDSTIKKLRTRSTNTKINYEESDSSSSTTSYTYERNNKPKMSKNVPIHLMHRSMQTSCISDITNKPAPYKLNCNNAKSNVKIVEPSFLSKLKKEAEIQKPVYVLYPNYVLPDLDFISTQDITKVLLMPQKAPETPAHKKRPFSCNDVEALKKKGFGHVRDWDSLNFLLPMEYKRILADVPEVAEHIQINNNKKEKPSFCDTKKRPRPISCDYSLDRVVNVSSSSSTATQPSSGYRGSSSMIDSQGSPAQTNFNPLFVYRYDSVTSSEASLVNDKQKPIQTVPPLPKRSISLDPYKTDLVPPRPPLPRGILRKALEKQPTKRYSIIKDDFNEEVFQKKKGFLSRNKRLSETEDEGVDAGTSSSSLDEQNDYPVRNPSPLPQKDILFTNLNRDELLQLEDFLKLSGISSDHDDLTEESLLQLRSYVGKFLSLKMNQQLTDELTEKKVSFAELGKNDDAKHVVYPPNNSPNVSAIVSQRSYQVIELFCINNTYVVTFGNF